VRSLTLAALIYRSIPVAVLIYRSIPVAVLIYRSIPVAALFAPPARGDATGPVADARGSE
ncbi:MAG: hypothetical protein AAB341_01995, partial [Planctomycetota bacterium]